MLAIYHIPLMPGHKMDMYSYMVEHVSLGNHVNRLY
jgi:hypothetical protein